MKGRANVLRKYTFRTVYERVWGTYLIIVCMYVCMHACMDGWMDG